jgi:predicted permease
LFLISIVPIAADTVVFATEFKSHPQKVAITVFLSTIFALIYIPAILTFVF